MLTALVWFWCAPGWAQAPANVLLVINKGSNASRTIGDYYTQRRHIAAGNVCSIHTHDDEEIDRATFDHAVRLPILACLEKGGLQDRVLYIVLTNGVPLKVKNNGQKDDQASVDSELTLLYQDLLGLPRVLPGKVLNPYFAKNSGETFVRFSHREFPMYLVTRLDGYTVADACALIDRALAPSKEGQFILDLPWDDNGMGSNWLRQAAERLKSAGIPASRINMETTPVFLTGQKEVLGYASWGSNDRSDHARTAGNTWVNGALMAEYVSTDARTFKPPPKDWKIGQWNDPPSTFFDGSPQSLIADYIHEGVTGAAGNVYEPYLDACVRPQILFPAYVRGLNLAESYYAAIPYLSWQTVVIGDPLIQPFPSATLTDKEIDPPKDSSTGLPIYLAHWKEVLAKKAH